VAARRFQFRQFQFSRGLARVSWSVSVPAGKPASELVVPAGKPASELAAFAGAFFRVLSRLSRANSYRVKGAARRSPLRSPPPSGVITRPDRLNPVDTGAPDEFTKMISLNPPMCWNVNTPALPTCVKLVPVAVGDVAVTVVAGVVTASVTVIVDPTSNVPKAGISLGLADSYGPLILTQLPCGLVAGSPANIYSKTYPTAP
jgi:hypothetical protein